MLDLISADPGHIVTAATKFCANSSCVAIVDINLLVSIANLYNYFIVAT